MSGSALRWSLAMGALGVPAACDWKPAYGHLPAELLAIDVSASQALQLGPFNEQLRLAHSKGEPWTSDPVQIISRFIDPEWPRTAVWAFSGTGERPGRYLVTIIVDGFPDDSVRGKRSDVTLERTSNGGWQIGEASYGWRCWRSRSASFAVDSCP